MPFNNPPKKTGGSGRSPDPRIFRQEAADPAVVALRMEDLTIWVAERVGKMSRDLKFTLGDRLIETCLEITTLLTEASYVRDKLLLLQGASRALVRARVLVRMSQRLQALTMAQREYFADQSVEIGRMIGGWTKATQSR